MLLTRANGGFVERKVIPVMFVPMTGKAQSKGEPSKGSPPLPR
jgi:hypothetical protein